MLAAICDDDKTDRLLVGKILQEKMKNRREPLTVEYFECGEDLVEKYESGKAKYDLLILDICMRYMDGMEAAKQIRGYDRKAAIIFLSDTPDYAVESYEVRATDYLLKPVREERMEEALNHFLEERYPKVRQSLLMISGSSGRRIAYDDILYIESRRMNLRVVCSGGVEHTVRKKLDDVQEELPKNRFLRCNQSFIVNMDYIRDADSNFTMCNGDIIPIKVREKKKIRKQYFDYLQNSGWEE
ncbi:response regulator transcription factor [[Clostridium] symbiosum]|uniref:LytR/AlgR family response regulator transcription factor n=1 Tax=Clostridium symbiosum TaxID=1512 RepID=UPI00156D974B|nr:LytTR family DNA-binding domain-containing protein [[Clostridium] symbiosum]NSI94491.1 response regulator transcription factor [[Clostridium] symbiosum]